MSHNTNNDNYNNNNNNNKNNNNNNNKNNNHSNKYYFCSIEKMMSTIVIEDFSYAIDRITAAESSIISKLLTVICDG